MGDEQGSLIDDLQLCHCDLDRNLNKVLRAIEGEDDISLLSCVQVPSVRRESSERYGRALESWMEGTRPDPDVQEKYQATSTLLGQLDRNSRLVFHLRERLRNNSYQCYPPDQEDFETTESRIQHLEICNQNWQQNLLILLEEIGSSQRTRGWHGPGLFCSCGDKDLNNTYPDMVRNTLETVDAKDTELLAQLKSTLSAGE